ncbi:MAG: ribbon-helix-helix domain-containing protein [Acidobacteriaceae bacterium]|nr:ribbon-helix-helix domain-containing protein [Acidobacteriaceae bacterium]
MGHTLTIRLTDDLLDWLKEKSRRTGIPVGRLIRQHLEEAKSNGGERRFLHRIGAIHGGPDDVSSRKGFSRS